VTSIVDLITDPDTGGSETALVHLVPRLDSVGRNVAATL